MSHKVVLVVKKPKVQRGVSNRAVASVSAVLVLVFGVAVLLNGDERSGLLEASFNDKLQTVREIHRAKTQVLAFGDAVVHKGSAAQQREGSVRHGVKPDFVKPLGDLGSIGLAEKPEATVQKELQAEKAKADALLHPKPKLAVKEIPSKAPLAHKKEKAVMAAQNKAAHMHARGVDDVGLTKNAEPKNNILAQEKSSFQIAEDAYSKLEQKMFAKAKEEETALEHAPKPTVVRKLAVVKPAPAPKVVQKKDSWQESEDAVDKLEQQMLNHVKQQVSKEKDAPAHAAVAKPVQPKLAVVKSGPKVVQKKDAWEEAENAADKLEHQMLIRVQHMNKMKEGAQDTALAKQAQASQAAELKRQEDLLADAQKDGKDKAMREQVKKSESDMRNDPYKQGEHALQSLEHKMLLKEALKYAHHDKASALDITSLRKTARTQSKGVDADTAAEPRKAAPTKSELETKWADKLHTLAHVIVKEHQLPKAPGDKAAAKAVAAAVDTTGLPKKK
jgi:hypothetical protein